MNRSSICKSLKSCSLLLVSVALFFSTVCNAHHQPVHQEIAIAAVNSSEGFLNFANETMGGTNSPIHFNPSEETVTENHPPFYWVGRGSYNQDYWPRWGNHFYTVKPNRDAGVANGLTDGGKITRIGLRNTTNSYIWATLKDVPTPTWHVYNFLRPHDPALGGVHVKNAYRWEDARDKQYQALTEPTKSTREERMAYMFYSLGHIIHLNQDVSQPDHARDDQHASRPYIEDFGGSSYENHPEWFNPKPHGWAYWREAGFKRLLDFWDRDRFKGGSASALIAEATGAPQHKLGLAEFSNGNFLGEDALYAENFWDTDDTHYFPFPSLAHTDQSQLKAGGWWSYMDSSILANGAQAPRPFLKKLGAGVHVEHHSVLKYLGAMNMGKMGSLPGPSAISIDAPEVLKDYHDILVPKAVEYSAGILDYFFRGQIDVCPTYSGTPGQYNLAIKNKSGEAFKDGAFRLFYDNADGDRTEIIAPDFAISYSGSLAANEVITATFTAPTEPVAAYMLVFKGTIGTTDDAASDSVDKDIAVAAKRFTWIGGPGESVPPEATAWVAALTKSVPSVSAVYSRQVCNTTGLLCENLDELLATFSIYNLVPSQSNLSLTPASTYSGPTFWLSISWGNGAINTALEIQNGFSSQLVYSVSASIGEAQGYAESCEDCVIAPPDPPVGDYPLTLQISPCDPSF